MKTHENSGRTDKVSRSLPPLNVTADVIRVLVADDDETSRRILTRALHQAGYDVITVKDGAQAWDILDSSRPPDIALLDWIMPGFSGPELCAMLKARSDVFVYTVLITGKNEQEDLIAGLESGAHEFLSKPVNLAEFNVRMSVAVRIVQYERDLAQKNEEISEYANRMEVLAEERAKQLIHADRINTLGVMSAGIIHEIKNPLTFISGNSQTFTRFWKDIDKGLKQAVQLNAGNKKRLEFIQHEAPTMLDAIIQGVEHITKIVSGLNRFAHKGSGERELVSIKSCIDDAVALSKNCWKYHVSLHVDVDELPPVWGNAQEIIQVLVNLIVNASDAMEGRQDKIDSSIHISLKAFGSFEQIIVQDNGHGIPDSIINKIWEPFFTTKEEGRGTGLGLAITYGIVKEHGGRVGVENVPQGGARFTIDLPVGEVMA